LRDELTMSAVCHGATSTPSGLLDSLTPRGPDEADEAAAEVMPTAVTASIPAAERPA
jgi:hypothetical protein